MIAQLFLALCSLNAWVRIPIALALMALGGAFMLAGRGIGNEIGKRGGG